MGKVSLPIGNKTISVTLNKNHVPLLVPPVILAEKFWVELACLTLSLPPLALKASSTLLWSLLSASVADIANCVILPMVVALPLIRLEPGSAIVIV